MYVAPSIFFLIFVIINCIINYQRTLMSKKTSPTKRKRADGTTVISISAQIEEELYNEIVRMCDLGGGLSVTISQMVATLIKKGKAAADTEERFQRQYYAENTNKVIN